MNTKNSNKKASMNSKGFSRVTTLIVLLCVAFVVLIAYLKFDAIKELILGSEITNEQQKAKFLLDQKVEVSGEIRETEDLLDASHYLIDASHGKFYLKSKSHNLFDYTGEVTIDGTIQDFLIDDPVVEVKSLIQLQSNNTDELTGGIEDGTGEEANIDEEKGYNFPEIGLWFDENFAEKYILLNKGGGDIVFQASGTQQNITISSFLCRDNKSAGENCEEIDKTLEESAEKNIINPIALKISKFSEIKSRYFTNGKRGYYINDATSEQVEDIANHMYINNDRYIKNTLLSNIDRYCADNQVVLTKYDNYKILSEDGKIYVNIDNNEKDTGKVFCRLELQGNKVLTRKFTYSDYEDTSDDNEENDEIKTVQNQEEDEKAKEKDEEDIVDESDDTKNDTENNSEKEKDDTNNKDNEDFDTTVEQFALKPSKSLTFNSARGHKIVFPSPSIAYQEVSSSVNFEQEGVNCFAQLNVINYKNEDKINTNPDVQVYECSIKGRFDDSSKTLIHKKLGDRHFVIKINNPAWNEFAHNIDIDLR